MIDDPESAGFDSRQLSAIGAAVRNGRLRNLHGVVVVRHDRLVFEQYFAGRDERLGRPLGEVAVRPGHLARRAVGHEERREPALRDRPP